MIYKKPNSKYWYTKFDLTFGGQIKRVNKSTRKTLKAEAEQVELTLREQLWEQLCSPAPAKHCWDEALLLYLDSRQGNKTVARKERIIRWWQQSLEVANFSAITSTQIRTLIAKQTHLSFATRNRYLSEIKALLNFIHKELEWIERVPAIRSYKETERPFYKLSDDEFERLLKAAPEFMRHIIIFAMSTGFRASNIVQLTWRQVDLESGVVSIHSSDHKSGSSVKHPLNETALALVRTLRKSSTSPYVFVNEFGKPTKDLRRRLWYQICKDANLEGLRFHDLRHNWASRHAESGTDILAIKELGGWKTIEMVQRYTHPSLEYLTQQANNINMQKNRLSEEADVVTNENQNAGCDKKSSHFVTVGDLRVLKDKAQKWKNLLFFSKLAGFQDGAQRLALGAVLSNRIKL